MVPRLVLASASPARLTILRAAGFQPDVVVSNVDESDVTGAAVDVARTLAVRKAVAVAARERNSLVLGCDSVLEFAGTAYGKPADARDAVRRWTAMRGGSGVLHTGHCLIDTSNRRQVSDVASTTVHFADLSDEEVAAYVDTGEPLRVAGAFTIDGLGGPFIERIEGDPHNVVGLSLPLLRHLLHHVGVPIVSLWRLSREAGSGALPQSPP